MGAIGDARADLAGKLTAGGVAGVTLDPASNPPFVLVDLATFDVARAGVGAWTGTVPVRVVVPPPGDRAAATALEDTVEACYRAVGWAPARPETYVFGTRAECPAYTLDYPFDVPNPDC